MTLRTLIAIGLLVAAAAAGADTRVYELDARNAKEIRDSLESVLVAQCSQTNVTGTAFVNPCHVELLSSGQLLVAAPDAAQAQVAEVLKAIAAHNASPTPRVTLQYWVLYGEPGKPDKPDAALKPLDSALQQLERIHGPIGFTVQDTTSITTQSGSKATSYGAGLQVNENVRANGDAMDLAVDLSFAPKVGPEVGPPPPQTLSVTVSIRRGEYLVLGERSAGVPDSSGRMFYIVHWPQGQ